MHVTFEILFIILLILANGVFSMAEMAVVSSRRARLLRRSEQGSRGASVALELADHPQEFLSTVQVGITLISIFVGAYGGATIAGDLTRYLAQFPQTAGYSESIAMGAVVFMITYLSLILGELVPKNLALGHADAIASAVARPMRRLSRWASPVVRLLSLSTRGVIAVLPIKKGKAAPVTAEEIRILMMQGAEHGTFEEAEQEMVEGVFRLGERTVADLMKPRLRVVWLDIEDDWATNERKVVGSIYSRFPVAKGDLDCLIGVVHVKDLFAAAGRGEAVDMAAAARKPLFVPEATSALVALDSFQRSGDQLAVVVDEYGAVQGIVTLTDLMEAVVGDLYAPGEEAPPQVMKRDDRSWLADGSIPVRDLLDALGLEKLPGDKADSMTLGGLVLAYLNRIPSPGDSFTVDDWQFEVVDMDGNRVDKVLIVQLPSPEVAEP